MKLDLTREFGSYFFGFVVGDGTIKLGNRQSVAVGLQRIDRGILEVFQRHLGGQIVDYESNKSSLWSLKDAELVGQLNSLGVVEGKSFDVGFKPAVLWECRHCVRGLLDSDGGISLSKPREGRALTIEVKFTQGRYNRGLVREFHEKVNVEGVVGKYEDYADKSECSYTGADAKHLLLWLYEGSAVFLGRKKEKADRFLAESSGRDWVVVRRNYDGKGTVKFWAEKFGIPAASMKDFLTREGLRSKEYTWRK